MVGTKEVCLMRVVHSCVVDECMYGYVETRQMQKQTSQKRWVEQFQARRKKNHEVARRARRQTLIQIKCKMLSSIMKTHSLLKAYWSKTAHLNHST